MRDPAEIAAVANALSWPQRQAILRADAHGLTDRQTVRGTLSNFGAPILDWSFRPARFTPLGEQVAAHIRKEKGL